MEMNVGTAIIGLVCTAVCFLPFFLIGGSRKKMEKAMLLSLENLAKNHQSDIGKYDYNKTFIIGFNNAKDMVFFRYEHNNRVINQSIELEKVAQCKCKKSKNKNTKNIQKLELQFTPKNVKNKVISFEIFNDQYQSSLNGELQLADKWAQLINDELK